MFTMPMHHVFDHVDLQVVPGVLGLRCHLICRLAGNRTTCERPKAEAKKAIAKMALTGAAAKGVCCYMCCAHEWLFLKILAVLARHALP